MEDPNDGRKMTLPIVSNIHNHALRQTNEHVRLVLGIIQRKRLNVWIFDPRRISGQSALLKPAVTGEEPIAASSTLFV